MCHSFWGHIQPAHLTDSAKLILNPHVCCSVKNNFMHKLCFASYSCWNKALWSFKSASLCLKITSYKMNETPIFVLLTKEYMVPEPVGKERIFLELILLEWCTSTYSVLTPLWSHSLLKCASQKSSYSNKYVFKAVTHVKLLSYKVSRKFLNCIV